MTDTTVAVAGVPERAVTGPTHRRTRWVAALVVAGVALPAIVAAIHVMSTHWFPAGDWAMLELRTRDVGTTHTPLVGPYSRYGWNHPGPLLFWYYAIPYRLTGSASWSLLTAAALANAMAVVGMLAFAWRRGGLALVTIVGVGLAILIAHLDTHFLWDPWNPWVTVLPLGLLVLAAWAATDGDRWGLAVAVLTGSFLVQAHIGYAVIVAFVLAWAAFGAWRVSLDRRSWYVVLGITVACTLPMFLDQFFGEGNLGHLLRYFGGNDSSPAGWSRALHVLSRELGGIAPWMGHPEPIEPIGGAIRGGGLNRLFVPIIVFVVSALAAQSCRAVAALRLQATVAIAALAGVISVSRISDEVFDYLVRWWWMLAMLWWASIAYSLWSFLVHHAVLLRRVETALAAATAVGIVWVGVATSAVAGNFPIPAVEFARPIAALEPPAVNGLPRGGSILIEGSGPRVGWLIDAFALQLDRAGFDVVLDDSQIPKAGEHRAASKAKPIAVFTIATGTRIDAIAAQTPGRELGRWDPLPPDERGTRTQVEQSLRAQLEAVGRHDLATVLDEGDGLWEATTVRGVDPSLVYQLDQYRRDGYPVAIFVEETGNAATAGTVNR
ncbi:MAG TPA: hypothetical protein VGQ20_03445 [Acidimicrobiales bacterium]|nr:hypothetical protein [Acidimicrobiales bacterium]